MPATRIDAQPPIGVQRFLVFGALATFVLFAALWPSTSSDEAYAAQQCGPNDAYRAALTTNTGHALQPCLSKVNLHIAIPRTRTASRGCGILGAQPCYASDKWSITGVERSAPQTVTYADGSTEQLYRLTFREFRVHKDATMHTTNGVGYTLQLRPAAEAIIGGSKAGITTDVWVTGSSTIFLDFLTENCHTGTKVRDPVLAVTGIVPVSANTGCGLDLNARYLVTSADSGSLDGQFSVQLPNTTLRVFQ